MKLNKYQKLIDKLFKEDQRDRKSSVFKKYSDKERLMIIGKRDQKRILILKNILSKKPSLKGIDYFRAGIVFQHGWSASSIKMAQKLAKISFETGYEPGRWLYAAATDRFLIMKGKKQKFGTQFRKGINGWELLPIRKNTTDAERKKFNVIPLHKIKKMLYIINRAGYALKPQIGLTRRKQ